ncbi:DUF2878 family protein [Leptospira kmetyi]|uniref:DUF2878 domain-containing protein n=1 Tax=Leptospira kmetyi TaxID=408139 RepID=A0AAD0ULJ4_9LEPT|nr:DUF2878 family protein [Leptospira kmetyi]AYV55081.1 DUF2878 family protein [Leptospira kmetyi]EQA53033.1 PF11086 domain protein [Leptospira kmetyi serovar Malaysia str. Bejo-Iso9]PJZ28216.1 DUF2878 domain-containing protein [Leptospira kmetyi]PJZ40093.1 DUF2878 domain-containing protein [Leptospira kmetyi]
MFFTLSEPFQNPKRLILLVLGGGIGLALCDQIHVQFSVLRYFHSGVFGQAWWVAPQFILATFLMYFGASFFKKESEEFEIRDFTLSLGWFVAAYLASGIFSGTPIVLALIYLGTWSFRIVFSQERKPLAIFSVLLAVCGTGAEALISNAGFFVYNQPDFLSVPIWLPGLYLHGAPLIWSLISWVKKR